MGSEPAAEHALVALTGGTGFIGSVLCRRLAAAGYRVRALYRPQPGRVLEDLPNLEWVRGDLADPAALKTLLAGAGVVVHCAGAVRGAYCADFDHVNERGVRDTVAAALNELGCQRYLLISSLAAREPQLSDYAGSKRRGELALAANAGRLDWTILRPPVVYGPGDREMRPLFRLMARGWLPILGSGRGRLSLLYVDDLASAIMRWLTATGDRGQTYELDDGHGGYDWDTLLDVAARVLRGGAPIHRLPIPLPLLRLASQINLVAAQIFGYAPMLSPGKVREAMHPDWTCDASAFARTTGWRPSFDFERGLARTFGQISAA